MRKTGGMDGCIDVTDGNRIEFFLEMCWTYKEKTIETSA